MSTELNLLPCPMCGAKPIEDGKSDYLSIRCEACDMKGPTFDFDGDDDAAIERAQGEAAKHWNRRASSADAVPDALPPLPLADEYSATRMLPNGELAPRYNAISMQAYACAAVEADRAQRPGHLVASKTAETRMNTGFAGGLLTDRAQQDEPDADSADLVVIRRWLQAAAQAGKPVTLPGIAAAALYYAMDTGRPMEPGKKEG